MIHFAVSLSVDEAAEKLIDAITACPMGLVAHINGQANCAQKGIAVPADQILEVFRPDYISLATFTSTSPRPTRYSRCFVPTMPSRCGLPTRPPASTFHCAFICTQKTV